MQLKLGPRPSRSLQSASHRLALKAAAAIRLFAFILLVLAASALRLLSFLLPILALSTLIATPAAVRNLPLFLPWQELDSAIVGKDPMGRLKPICDN
jgi:hypothetical protein